MRIQVLATTQRRKLSTFSVLFTLFVDDFKKLELRIKTFFSPKKKVQQNKLKEALVVVKRSSMFSLCWSSNIVEELLYPLLYGLRRTDREQQTSGVNPIK